MQTKHDVLNALDRYGLGHLREVLNPLLKPAMRIHLTPVCDPGHYEEPSSVRLIENDVQIWPRVPTEPVSDTLPIAVSKFGGYPDVAADFIWPRDEYNEPLPFFAQINLREIESLHLGSTLPTDGLLVLFLDSGFHEWCAIFYREDLTNLVKTEPPADIDDLFRLPPPYRISFSPEWTLPSGVTFEMTSINLSDTEIGQYYEFQKSLISVTGELDYLGNPKESHHSLLGWADSWDGDGRAEWSHEIWEDPQLAKPLDKMTEEEKAQYNNKTSESCLFLQVETSNFHNTWGYGWEPFFYIRERDLGSSL